MQPYDLSVLQLIYELCSDVVVDHSMECLEASSLVSYQLEKAEIPHRLLRGSLSFSALGQSATF